MKIQSIVVESRQNVVSNDELPDSARLARKPGSFDVSYVILISKLIIVISYCACPRTALNSGPLD